jgi:hypothetical protein
MKKYATARKIRSKKAIRRIELEFANSIAGSKKANGG